MIEYPLDIESLQEEIEKQVQHFDHLDALCRRQVIGQNHMIRSLKLALLTRGHILLEGMPGLAKTLAIRTLAEAMEGHFSRIQFTPDLLPSDLIGTMVFDPGLRAFKVRKGPVFANFVLADEINRAPAKVQSALLEVMQERQVTIGDETFRLDEPFVVMATQNPIEQEGTFPLPEAQLDRFAMKVLLDYPSRQEEERILHQHLRPSSASDSSLQPVSVQSLLDARKLVERIYVDPKIEKYILDIVFCTRFPNQFGLTDLSNTIQYGVSPRGSIYLALCARAQAFLNKRAFVLPEDVKSIAKDVLRHRIGLSFEAEVQSVTTDQLLDAIIHKIAIP
jgi:MoxR-like ATPase